MSSKPIVSALALTILSAIPLGLLSTGDFQVTLSNLPVLLVTLFTLLLICAYWNRGSDADGDDMSSDSDYSDRESGKVKWFNPSKGFGFITRDSGDDVFVHFRSIRGKGHRVLQDGQRVEFAVSESEKGLQAEDVAIAR